MKTTTTTTTTKTEPLLSIEFDDVIFGYRRNSFRFKVILWFGCFMKNINKKKLIIKANSVKTQIRRRITYSTFINMICNRKFFNTLTRPLFRITY